MEIKLSEEEVEAICDEDHDDWVFVEEFCRDTDYRWHDMVTCVIRNVETDNHYFIYFQEGKTDMQDNIYDEQTLVEVVQKTITKTTWVEKN